MLVVEGVVKANAWLVGGMVVAVLWSLLAVSAALADANRVVSACVGVK